MYFVLLWLLNAWLLGLFGFDTMFISGMFEVFGLVITKTGYYFIFALVGLANGIGFKIGGNKLEVGNKDKKDHVQ